MKLRVLLLLLPALTACDFFNTSLPCRNASDCPQAETCSDVGRCELVEIDGGANGFSDGGRDDVDAGPDGGVNEVDAGDAGGPIDIDAGIDAGPNKVDAGVDAGPNDVDAGVDAGPNDAGADAGPNDVDAGADAGPNDVDAGADAGPNFLDGGPNFPFEVISVDLDSIPVPVGLTSQDLGDCIATVVVFDSTDGSWRPPNCAFPSAQLSYQGNLNDAGPVAVLLVESLNIPANRELRLVGDHPVVIAATTSITINGTIDARGNSQRMGTGGDQNKSEPGAGGNNAIVCVNSTGADAGLSGGDEGHGGGGGGGTTIGAMGGLANKGNNVGGVGGLAISVSNFIGGCAGGNGSGDRGNDINDRGQGGAGGGAVHLIAAAMISGTGSINVSGGGGTAPDTRHLGGGGGGSGGTILLTADIIDTDNMAFHAGGGGGASGASNTDNDVYFAGYRSALTSPTAFGGGTSQVLSDKLPGRGGVGGSDWPPTNGENAIGSDHAGGGGGGGAAGRIVLRAINTCAVASMSYPSPTALDACSNGDICGDGTRTGVEECDFGAFNIAGVGAGKVACGCSHDCMDVPCYDDGAIPTSTEECDDCTRTYTNGDRRVVFCERGPCTMKCTDVSTSCDLICTSGETCTMDCTDSNTCNMFCDANSNCNFSKCDNTTCETFQTTQTPSVGTFVDPD